MIYGRVIPETKGNGEERRRTMSESLSCVGDVIYRMRQVIEEL